MNRKIIPLQVRDEYIIGAGGVIGAEGSGNDVALQLEFGAMWEGLVKYVTFRDALGENPEVLMVTADMMELLKEEKMERPPRPEPGRFPPPPPPPYFPPEHGLVPPPPPPLKEEDGEEPPEKPVSYRVVYNVPVPKKAKAVSGEMMVTVHGYAVNEDGTQKEAATVGATAYFRVLPAAWAVPETEGFEPPTVAQQMQAQIERIQADIVEAAKAADAKEAARKSAEKAAKSAEDAEKSAEKADKAIRTALDERRNEAEQLISAEAARAAAENARTAAETERAEAEGQRATAEQGRESAEAARAAAETARTAAETGRETAEEMRSAAEEEREAGEGRREAAETARAAEEQKRVAAEADRAAAEALRESAGEGIVARAEAAVAEALKNLVHDGAYDLMGTAANLVGQHNSDAAAHSDLRQQAAQAAAVAEAAKQEAQQAAQAAAGAQAAADAALSVITDMASRIDVVPSQAGRLVYTGSAQAPEWNSYDGEAMTIGGTTSATDAGTYTATFTPKEGLHWADGSSTAKEVVWTIGRAPIAAVPYPNSSPTYTGSAQSPAWVGYDAAKMTIGGTSIAADAGSYTAVFTPTANYQWPDGTAGDKSVTWSILRASITAIPRQSGSLTYTGSAQSPVWTGYDAAKMTIGGTFSAVNAGSYTAVFTPTANYQWPDGTTGGKNVSWSIGKAAGTLTLSTSAMTLSNSAKSGTITVTRAGDGAISATSSNTGVATVSVSGNVVTVTGKGYGTAVVTVKVAAGANHNAPANKTCAVTANVFSSTLSDNTWAVIGIASAAGEAKNCWSVGDEKPVALNGSFGNGSFGVSNLTVNAFIIGFDHNAGIEGTGKTHFQLGKIGGKLVAFSDQYYPTNAGGIFSMGGADDDENYDWKASGLRNDLGCAINPQNAAGGFAALLPAELRAVIKPCVKYSGYDGIATKSTDYLFILSGCEYMGSAAPVTAGGRANQAQYDYYKAGNSRIHYGHGNAALPRIVWTRDKKTSYPRFNAILENGNVDLYAADADLAVSIAFCV